MSNVKKSTMLNTFSFETLRAQGSELTASIDYPKGQDDAMLKLDFESKELGEGCNILITGDANVSCAVETFIAFGAYLAREWSPRLKQPFREAAAREYVERPSADRNR